MSQLSTTFRHQVSWNGYPLDLVKSGLQKYIRRGETEKALYCAGEIDLFKTAEKEGEVVRTNLLNRFLVIYMEDVENLSIIHRVHTLTNQLYEERKKTERRSTADEERWMSELVVLLCQSTKARICSHIRAIFNPTYHTSAMMAAYPSIRVLWEEIAKDEAERVEKSQQKLAYHSNRFAHYLQTKNILAVYYAFQIAQSEEVLEKRILGSAKPVWFLFNLLSQVSPVTTITMSWYKNHLKGMKEEFMCWLVPLISYLGYLPKGTIPLVEEAYPMNWDDNRAGKVLVMDDYVVDRHTKMGRSKSLIEFAVIGAHVENEAEYVEPMWKAFYNDGKRFEEGMAVLGDGRSAATTKETEVSAVASNEVIYDLEEERENPPNETAAYDFIVRTQISTSNSKMDVYLATDTTTKKLVIVKGPYQSRKEITILEGVTEWKKAHHLPFVPFIVRSLLPDRWPEGVALGARNRVSRSDPAYFFVFDCVISKEEIQTKMHSSKVWPLTEVIDWKKIPLHFDYEARPLTNQEWKDYVHALLFRYVVGISDLADRNFLMRDGRVISIDEDIEGHEVHLYKELKKNKAAAICIWVKTHYDELGLMNWKVKDEYNEGEKLRLACIQDKNKCVSLFQAPVEPIALSEAALIEPSTVHIVPKTGIALVLSLLETLGTSELLQVIQSATDEIEKKAKK